MFRNVAFVALLLTSLFLSGQAWGINPAAWSISESTMGEDVFWTSPTAVDVGLPRYYTSFEITRVEVYTALGGTDVTGLLEATTGGGIVDSLPATLLNENLIDDTTGTTATVLVDIDGSGFGQFAFTDITLGTFLLFPITQIDVDTDVTVQGLVPGDFDTDFVVDDVDYGLWEASFAADAGADTDFDGDSDGIDFLDWQRYLGSDYTSLPAVAAVSAAVPEPAGVVGLLVGGMLVMVGVRKRKN